MINIISQKKLVFKGLVCLIVLSNYNARGQSQKEIDDFGQRFLKVLSDDTLNAELLFANMNDGKKIDSILEIDRGADYESIKESRIHELRKFEENLNRIKEYGIVNGLNFNDYTVIKVEANNIHKLINHEVSEMTLKVLVYSNKKKFWIEIPSVIYLQGNFKVTSLDISLEKRN